jgi:hypothetical protein
MNLPGTAFAGADPHRTPANARMTQHETTGRGIKIFYSSLGGAFAYDKKRRRVASSIASRRFSRVHAADTSQGMFVEETLAYIC